MYCSKFFPDAILNHLVRRRLGSEPSKVTADATDESLAANDLTVEEVSSREPSFDEAVLSNSRPDVTVGTVMVSANPFVSIILPPKPHIHLDIYIILLPCLHLRAVVCSCLLKPNPF